MYLGSSTASQRLQEVRNESQNPHVRNCMEVGGKDE